MVLSFAWISISPFPNILWKRDPHGKKKKKTIFFVYFVNYVLDENLNLEVGKKVLAYLAGILWNNIILSFNFRRTTQFCFLCFVNIFSQRGKYQTSNRIDAPVFLNSFCSQSSFFFFPLTFSHCNIAGALFSWVDQKLLSLPVSF